MKDNLDLPEAHQTDAHPMARRSRWRVLVGVMLFLGGSTFCLYWQGMRSRQAIEFAGWYIIDNNYSGATGAVKDVDCPPSLAENETGTVTAKVFNGGATADDLTVFFYVDDPFANPSHRYRDQVVCEEIVTIPGERYADVSCRIVVSDVSGNWLAVMANTGHGSIAKIRTPGCSIWISPIPGYGGTPAILMLFGPGLLSMAVGSLLWFWRRKPSRGADWSFVILSILSTGCVLAGVILAIWAGRFTIVAFIPGSLFSIMLGISLVIFSLRRIRAQ